LTLDIARAASKKHGEERMHRHGYKICLAAVALATLSVGPVWAQEYRARLNGFNELGALNAETGAILTNGTGTLTLDVDPNSQTARYKLTYSDLSSTPTPPAQVLQAHLHFAKVHVPGGIYAFLCTNLSNGPAGTPACPNPSGTVTGTITPASILAVTGQNITAGDFTALLRALRSNTTYPNVHTNNFKAGEIRGQVQLAPEDEDEGGGQNRQ
jgi:hypothetical protein